MSVDEPASAQQLRRRQRLKGTLAAALPLGGPLPLLAAPELVAGGLPVTCKLTLPVACVAANAGAGGALQGFEYSKYEMVQDLSILLKD